MSFSFRLAQSHIHGVGVFATQTIVQGEMVICPGIETGHHGFRGFNHSCDPNLDSRCGIAHLKAMRTIQPGEELTVDYYKDQGARDRIRRKGGCRCPVCRSEHS